jgi:hypothetical protein
MRDLLSDRGLEGASIVRTEEDCRAETPQFDRRGSLRSPSRHERPSGFAAFDAIEMRPMATT